MPMMSLRDTGRRAYRPMGEQFGLPSASTLFAGAFASQRYLAVAEHNGTSFAYLPTLIVDTDIDGNATILRQSWNGSDGCGLHLLDKRDAFAFESGSNPIAEPGRCSSHAERGSP